MSSQPRIPARSISLENLRAELLWKKQEYNALKADVASKRKARLAVEAVNSAFRAELVSLKAETPRLESELRKLTHQNYRCLLELHKAREEAQKYQEKAEQAAKSRNMAMNKQRRKTERAEHECELLRNGAEEAASTAARQRELRLQEETVNERIQGMIRAQVEAAFAAREAIEEELTRLGEVREVVKSIARMKVERRGK